MGPGPNCRLRVHEAAEYIEYRYGRQVHLSGIVLGQHQVCNVISETTDTTGFQECLSIEHHQELPCFQCRQVQYKQTGTRRFRCRMDDLKKVNEVRRGKAASTWGRKKCNAWKSEETIPDNAE